NIVVDQNFEPGIRVTVAMGTDRCLETGKLLMFLFDGWCLILCARLCHLPLPRRRIILGYKVRYARNINYVFKDYPFEGGYDQKIGTYEHGVVLSSSKLTIPTF
ncbi:hypothetical protein MKW92_037576, partial [Papaver armeniacum]